MDSQIKMIVTDLDGTLLRTDKTISQRTKKTLDQCRKQGIKLVYATGRAASGLCLASPQVFDGCAIANGAIATAGGTTVYKRLIKCEDARPLLIACDKRGLSITSQFGDMDYSNFIMSDIWPDVTAFTLVDYNLHDKDTEKIFTYNLTAEDMVFIQKHMPPCAYMVTAVDGVVMISHKEATKSNAVAALAAHWGINQSEIVAFGDDLNDVDMLTYAGIGIAMGNALEEVKAVADCTCPSNDEDGLAQWLESNILFYR
ncbi:MAG: HAD family hydrolase [Defluviitaleaceae bacterium]|nr:HAD family hydrolase [Defluviitaleaceae bacterium]